MPKEACYNPCEMSRESVIAYTPKSRPVCVRVRAGIAAVAAFGLTLCRCRNPQAHVLSLAAPTFRWAVPAEAAAVQTSRNVDAAVGDDSRRNKPSYRPIAASLAHAHQLRVRARSRVGGLYGP